MKKSSIVFVVSCLLLPAMAQARDFKVYGYKTPDAGEIELVYWTDYVLQSDQTMKYFGQKVDRESLWAHTLEVEYGVTDRFTLAAYVDYEQPDGEDFELVQARIVAARYRFGEPGEHAFDTALYVEYYLPREGWQGEAKEKAELRLIMEKDLGGSTLTLNPKFEKVTSGPEIEEGLEFEYGVSLYSKWRGAFKWGLEAYGGIGEFVNLKPVDRQKHYLVPAATWKVAEHLKWNLGAAFGLTDAADDVVLKSILEWEI